MEIRVLREETRRDLQRADGRLKTYIVGGGLLITDRHIDEATKHPLTTTYICYKCVTYYTNVSFINRTWEISPQRHIT